MEFWRDDLIQTILCFVSNLVGSISSEALIVDGTMESLWNSFSPNLDVQVPSFERDDRARFIEISIQRKEPFLSALRVLRKLTSDGILRRDWKNINGG
jgi:hypothetical protein